MDPLATTQNKGIPMKDHIRKYVKECLSEGVKVTGGGHTFKAKPGSQVSFTDATSGKAVSGTFKKKVSRGGHQYAHVETGKASHYVPVHQMHGAKKIDEEDLQEVSKEKLGKYIKAAAMDKSAAGLAHHAFYPEYREKNMNTMRKRQKYIDKAVDKLTKE